MTHEDTEEMQPLRSHSRHCSVSLITFQSQGLELSPLRGGEGAGEATQNSSRSVAIQRWNQPKPQSYGGRSHASKYRTASGRVTSV